MLKRFDFECATCAHEFEELVEGAEGQPEECPKCGNAEKFKKLIGLPSVVSKIIISPGSKHLKAGYQHTHARPAEKGKSQVSFAGLKK